MTDEEVDVSLTEDEVPETRLLIIDGVRQVTNSTAALEMTVRLGSGTQVAASVGSGREV